MGTARTTSKAAFEQITREGLLSEKRLAVYSALFQHGPLTGAEIVNKHGISGAWKRLSELRNMGVVEEVGLKECAVTGQTVTLWDVTDKLPRMMQTTAPRKRSQDIIKEKDEVIQLLHDTLLEGVIAREKDGVSTSDVESWVTKGKYAVYKARKSLQDRRSKKGILSAK